MEFALLVIKQSFCASFLRIAGVIVIMIEQDIALNQFTLLYLVTSKLVFQLTGLLPLSGAIQPG